jgi:diguanylate cyclase (GGDEF)-like protein/PAS domain S-box-containing protein
MTFLESRISRAFAKVLSSGRIRKIVTGFFDLGLARPAAVLVAANVFVGGLIGFFLRHDYDRDQDRAETALRSMSGVLDRDLSRLLERVDATLLTVVDEAERELGAGAIDPDVFTAFLRRHDSRLPEPIGLRVTDAQGQIIYAVKNVDTPSRDVSDREYFTHWRDDSSAGLFISQPFVGRVWPAPQIILSRRYQKADGSFAGIVDVAVGVDSLSAILAEARDLGPSVRVLLWDNRQVLEAQYAASGHPLASDAKPPPGISQLIAGNAPPTIFRFHRAELDDGLRMAHFRKISGWPLYLTLGIAERDAVAGWWLAVLALGGLGGIFLSASIGAFIVFLRNSRTVLASETRYRGLFDHMHGGFTLREAVIDDQGRTVDFRFLAANDAYLEIHGLDTVVGKTMTEIWPELPHHPIDWVECFRQVVQTGIPVRAEAYWAKKSRWFQLTVYRTGPTQIGVVSYDISEHKRAELTARRLSDLYAALSQTNQCIVRATSQAELFDEICRIAIEFAHLRMAWIGMIDNHARKVVPMARAGTDTDFLDDLPISTDPASPFSAGPTGRAAATGTPCIHNDIEASRKTIPRHDEIHARGVRSAAAFPLMTHGVVVGTLSLYSADTNFFAPDLVRLLDEMVSDISFALDRLADEVERRRLGRDLVVTNARIHAVIEGTRDIIATLDPDLRFTGFNSAFAKVFRTLFDDDPQIGASIVERLANGTPLSQRFLENWRRALAGERSDLEWCLGTGDPPVYYDSRYGPLLGPNGERLGAFLLGRDITLRKAAEHRLRDQESRLRLALDAAQQGWFELNLQTGEVQNSAEYARILGFDPNAFPTNFQTWQDNVHPDDASTVLLSFQRSLEPVQSLDIEYRRRGRSGEWQWLRTVGRVVAWDDDGRPLKMAGVHMDVGLRKQAEERLQLAASVFTEANEGIVITDTAGVIIDVNKAFSRLTGYSRDEAIGNTPRMLKSGHHSPDYYATLWQSLTEKGHWYGELWNRRKDGSIFAEKLTIGAVCDAAGRAKNYVGLFTDITAMKEYQQQLEHMANYDVLTSLPNRVLLADRLQLGIAQCERRGGLLAVGYLDLDGFKEINDKYGHHMGDLLLVAIAQSVKDSLRKGDTLARIGGDEFTVVLPDLERLADCEAMMARMLAAANTPVTIQGMTLRISASIGVTVYPRDSSSPDLLIRHADQAMYSAKHAGRNCYRLFDVESDTVVRARADNLRRIRLALDRREFVLWYQPKVNMRTGTVIGAEALIRWQHPERGLLSPAEFLPLIQDEPLDIDLGDWVIETAIAQVESWRVAGLELQVSINVGARQLQHPNFVPNLRRMLADHADVVPSLLEFEILETSALADIGIVGSLMQSCREMGIRFSIDDFGTGYSSLTYLRRLPVELIKIDRTFVGDMLESADDLAIVVSIVGLAQAFGREVIAEGVETPAHGEALLKLGCDLAQGYGIARPMPGNDLPAWVATWEAAAKDQRIRHQRGPSLPADD